MKSLYTWCAIEEMLDRDSVLKLFRRMYPEAIVVSEEVAMEREDLWMEKYDFVIGIGRPKGEYQTHISIAAPRTPEKDYDNFNITNGRCLAKELGCRVLVDGTGFGDDDTPYWSLIIDRDTVYLANDGGTNFADSEGGPVRIVRTLTAVFG